MLNIHQILFKFRTSSFVLVMMCAYGALTSHAVWANSTSALKYQVVLPPDQAQEGILLAYKFLPTNSNNDDDKTIGKLSDFPIYISHAQELEGVETHQIIELTQRWAGVEYYVPGVAIRINNEIYYTDARYVYIPGENISVYEKHFNVFNQSPRLANLPEKSGHVVHRQQYKEALSSPAGYRGEGYKAPEGTTGPAPGIDFGTTPTDSSSTTTGGDTATSSSSSDLGNDISVDLAGSIEEPADSGDSSTVETPIENIPRPMPRPKNAEYSAEALEGISLAVKDSLQAEMISNNGTSTSGNFDLPKGTRLKIIPDGKTEVINGQTWREVEYIWGFDRRRLMVPQNQLLTTEGQVLTDSTPLRIGGTGGATVATPASGSTSSADEPATPTSSEGTSDGTGASEVAQPAAEVPVKDSNVAAVSTCSNPEYLNYLTNKNPDCKLLGMDRLVRSGLKEGDTVLAMRNRDKTCFRVSVGMMAYSDDDVLSQEIERITKNRKDSYDEISRFLQNGHLGFVSQSEPQRNRFTISCHDRTQICSLGFGFEAAQRVPHIKTFTTPSVGLSSNPSTDHKIQIFGPTSDGLYVVRHMYGHSPRRVFLVNDRSKINEAIRMMDQHVRDHSNIQLSEADKAKAIRQKMVLYTQVGDETGDKESRTIELNPKQPFKQISQLNKDFKFYRISCQREYDPLQELPAASTPTSQGSSTTVE